MIRIPVSITSELPISSTRRRLAQGLLALTTTGLVHQRRSFGAEASASVPGGHSSNAVQFTWAVRSGQREASRADALRQSAAMVANQRQTFEPPPEEAEDYGDPAFAPMVVIAGAAAIAIIADVVIRFRRELNGGLIVDLRTNTVNVRENPKIAGGMVIVVGPDKAIAKFEPNAQLDAASLIKAIAEVSKKAP